MKERWMLAVALAVILIGGAAGGYLAGTGQPGQNDLICVNRIVRQAEEQWGDFSQMTSFGYDFTVIDRQGKCLYQTAGANAGSLAQAVRANWLIMDVNHQGTELGKVLIDTGMNDRLRRQSIRLAVFFAGLAVLLGLVILAVFWFLNFRVLKPFRTLQAFAQDVAGGKLDIPLTMDKNNLFGPFTESFDLMRTELARAKQQEALANQQKKELSASLSHDIKTPVTSIALLSELMVMTAEGSLKEKAETIRGKADQISRLVDNLFQSSLEEMGQLKVAAAEEHSSMLPEMLRQADYNQRANPAAIPECLIRIDVLRMQQVFDNIIHNSYKYADTDIQISASIVDEFLRIRIRDFGPGVEPEELAVVCSKYYRGKNARDSRRQGAGLGLYLASWLMEQMGGMIRLSNASPGFCVEIFIGLV